jgi:serine/threonine-protein kinase
VWTSSSESTPETLAFLQRRVALFGLSAGGLGLIFLVFRTLVSLSGAWDEQIRHPNFLFHLLAVVLLLGAWLACRAGTRSRRFIQVAETVGLVGSSLAYEVMGLYLPLFARPDMIVQLALTYTLMARAVYVPSSARRTLVLGLAVGLPLVGVTYLHFLGADEVVIRTFVPGSRLPSAVEFATMAATTEAVWWALTTVLASATSSVIYGLRREVREARKLGPYTLEEKLGEGGMGIVYRASHAMLRRPTAVKLLPGEKAGEHNVARFEREVQLTASLTHPNTVTIYDFGRTAEGIFYYAMELLDGVALDVLVDLEGAQPAERALHVLDGVAAALEEAHEVGLIHRDIKPANIILCKQGGVFDVPKVLDFGLVKDISVGAVSLTATGSVAGTPLYMAPESILTPGSLDARSDLYALGAVGYYLVTGTHVFTGQSAIEVCSHHLHTKPERPSARLGRAVPADLEKLLLACLEKEADRRPQTASELRRRVRECQAYGAWDRERARRWWLENGDKVKRSRGEDPTFTRDGLARLGAVK